MKKVASVNYPNSTDRDEIEYYDKEDDAVLSILYLTKVHNCRVTLLRGFTDEEVVLLEDIYNVKNSQTIC